MPNLKKASLGVSFHWKGKNQQGVSMWTGSWDKPLYQIGRCFTPIGMVAGCGGLAALLSTLFTHAPKGGLVTLALIGLVDGVLFTAIGKWALGMHRHVAALSPTEQVCQKLGVDEATLVQMAEARNIKPKIIINDEPFYELSDFTEAMTLLRASQEPEAQQKELLRAASGGSTTPAEELLRPNLATSQVTTTAETSDNPNILSQR